VMRSFRIVTSTMFSVALAGLQAVVITLVHGSRGTTKDVLAIVVEAIVTPVRIPKRIPVERPVIWSIGPHDHDSALGLRRRVRQQHHHAGEKQCGQNEASKST